MTGCSTPMQFEKNNDLAINVYSMKHDGKMINPLRITKKVVRLEDMVNLLLIEGEEKVIMCG